MKAVLRGKFISWSAFKKKKKKSTNKRANTMAQALEKEEQTNTKSSTRQEIFKIRAKNQ